MRYAVVIEQAETNFSSYVLDLPGCVATGETAEDAKKAIREAIDQSDALLHHEARRWQRALRVEQKIPKMRVLELPE